MMATAIKTYEDYMEIGKTGVEITRKVKFGGKEFSKIKDDKFSFWNEKTGKYSIFTKSSFTKHYTGIDHNITDVITSDAELGKMYRIMRCINEINMIIYKDSHTKKGAPANKELLYKMTGYDNRNSARRFINKMVDLGIIKEGNIGGNERYFVNPLYTMKGADITLLVYQLFKEQLDPFLREQAKIELEGLCYYENNPDEYIELKRKHQKEQEEAADKLLNEIGSAEREQELALEEALDKVVVKTRLINDPAADCSFIQSTLDYIGSHDPEFKIELAITPETMTNPKRKFLVEAIAEYRIHKDQDRLVTETFGLLKKVKREIALAS